MKKKILLDSFWTAGGQLVYLLILLGSNVWLARILSPEEFGQVGIIMFFIVLSNVLTECGFGGALIRKKNISRDDYSTVFIFNIIVSILCYLILLTFSGYIADFYNDALLKELLSVSGLILIINAFQVTQNAKIISEQKFKRKSILRIISVFIGSVLGVFFAYKGLGVWSLVYMQLSTSLVLTILYWLYEGFFFSLSFSKSSFKELSGFGVNTTLASLLTTAFDNIYQLVLGRYFSVNQVGLYYQAKKLQDVPGGIINTLAQSVFFSSLAKLQDDKKKFIESYNKITLLFLVSLGFISCFIYIYAKPIILLFYGDRWMDATFYIQLLTIASFFYYQEKINRIIFKVFNKTKQVLYLEILKKAIQSISIIIGIIALDINVLLIGFVVTNIIGYYINFYYSRKIIGVETKFELLTISKVVLLSILCILITSYINSYIPSIYLYLMTIPVLILLYMVGIQILKITNITSVLNLLKSKI